MNRYLKYIDAMKYMGIKSYKTLWKMIDEGLPVIKFHGVKRIDKEEIDKFLSSKTKGGE